MLIKKKRKKERKWIKNLSSELIPKSNIFINIIFIFIIENALYILLGYQYEKKTEIDDVIEREIKELQFSLIYNNNRNYIIEIKFKIKLINKQNLTGNELSCILDILTFSTWTEK